MNEYNDVILEKIRELESRLEELGEKIEKQGALLRDEELMARGLK